MGTIHHFSVQQRPGAFRCRVFSFTAALGAPWPSLRVPVFPSRFLKRRHATASAAVNMVNTEHLSGELVNYSFRTLMG
jgi:hypothetical protein